ncbi:MAG TPA: heparinase II/III family protein [Alphaproteobacteria bacterium]|nr:heparinase II/III family protein [Alphaproteobacteria bacterium]
MAAPSSTRHSAGLRDRIANFIFASSLYRLTLRGEPPRRLKRLPPAPWPGDAEHGKAILAGRFTCGGQPVNPERPDWYSDTLSETALRLLHSFGYLNDLAEAGGEAAQDRARALIASWLDSERIWHPIASDPEVAGRRIAAWLSHARFIVRGNDDKLGPRILASLTRQLRHLGRTVGRGREGVARLYAIRGAVYASLCGLDDERRAAAAYKLLRRELRRQILADGGHIERSPLAQLEALAALVDLRDMALDADQPVPGELAATISRMAAILRFLRHGDGALPLFNGASERSTTVIDAVLLRSGVKGKAADSAPQLGFQRLAAGRALVLIDAGAPPPAGFDHDAHAGTLSFEMAWGQERIIVNCGARPSRDPAWQTAQRATAAHSTMVVDDTNSSEILPGGGIGRRPEHVECTREEDNGSVWVTGTHDGYRPMGLVHQRRLYLSADGEDLRGEDTLTGAHTGSFAVRFHLHPEVQVSVIQNGGAALVRAPSGTAWRFIASGGKIELAETIYLGRRGEPRRAEQIVVSGPVSNGAAVKWALRRIPKA